MAFLLYSVYIYSSAGLTKCLGRLCFFDMFEDRFITHFVLVSGKTVPAAHFLPTFAPDNRIVIWFLGEVL